MTKRLYALWFLTLLFVGCGRSEQVTSIPKPSAPPEAGWQFLLDYSETPPNPGAGAPTTRLRFSVSQSGTFTVTQVVHATSGEVTRSSKQSGQLEAGQRDQLTHAVDAADLLSLPPGRMELAGGSGTEDGWGGTVTFSGSGKTTVIAFSSGGGHPMDPKAQERLSRFSAFLAAVKSIAQSQLKHQ